MAPALVGPSKYDQEPSRDSALVVNSKTPFNAEPPANLLADSYVTPSRYFYKRNHGPVPCLEDPERYRLVVGGRIPQELEVSLVDLKQLPKETVVATLQCAGNRRTEMSTHKKVRGVGWGPAAVGTAVWGGVKLWRVLELAGIPPRSSSSPQGGLHVEFESVDQCKEEEGGPYKASIPLQQAALPELDVLLAYEMNGEPLPRDHGYPLRVIVPGVIGARSVKWLTKITVLQEDCQGFFQQRDYKMFPPWVDWDTVQWNSRSPIMDMPVQCAICQPLPGAAIPSGTQVTFKGYAFTGAGRSIERVDISVDGGRTWQEARRMGHGPEGRLDGGKWAWMLWQHSAVVSTPCEVIARAVDSAANTQPEKVETIWNLRGVLNNSWHHVNLKAAPQRLRSSL